MRRLEKSCVFALIIRLYVTLCSCYIMLEFEEFLGKAIYKQHKIIFHCWLVRFFIRICEKKPFNHRVILKIWFLNQHCRCFVSVVYLHFTISLLCLLAVCVCVHYQRRRITTTTRNWKFKLLSFRELLESKRFLSILTIKIGGIFVFDNYNKGLVYFWKIKFFKKITLCIDECLPQS